MDILVNKYQTQITDELLSGLPQEVQDQLLDIINNVEFVKRLISPARQYAKDRPRDSQGRIIVDLVNPHILEDMDMSINLYLYTLANSLYCLQENADLAPKADSRCSHGRGRARSPSGRNQTN